MGLAVAPNRNPQLSGRRYRTLARAPSSPAAQIGRVWLAFYSVNLFFSSGIWFAPVVRTRFCRHGPTGVRQTKGPSAIVSPWVSVVICCQNYRARNLRTKKSNRRPRFDAFPPKLFPQKGMVRNIGGNQTQTTGVLTVPPGVVFWHLLVGQPSFGGYSLDRPFGLRFFTEPSDGLFTHTQLVRDRRIGLALLDP